MTLDPKKMELFPYSRLVQGWKRVRRGNLFEAGRAADYPIYGWKCAGPGPAIYLSAGIHGDEPAGPMAVTRLLEDQPRWMRGFSWTIFPCLNPWGYERDSRRNARRLDLNRLWRENREPEIRAVRKLIHGRRFELAFLMHEDYDAKGFYLYELAPERAPFGEKIVRAVRSIMVVETRRAIENRRVTAPGLIRRGPSHRPEGRRRWPEAFYLIDRHAAHLFTSETPSTGFDLGLRIRAQIKGLRSALALLRDL